MSTDLHRNLVRMAVFFIAMAFLESAVVVYLRALYYPEGFAFPLVPMDGKLVGTEVGREFATLVMLMAPGLLVTRSLLERFAWFCFGFGVWDLFYYVWLKVLLDWPASLACLLCSGALLMIGSFVLEPWQVMLDTGTPAPFAFFDPQQALAVLEQYRPQVFPLELFLVGAGLSASGLLWTAVRMH
ncbi:MAG: hypothetical protein IPK99_10840 [Flavobacteriales bacterium]|nr:hypothetical protein [Flavobacteriales bacterium]